MEIECEFSVTSSGCYKCIIIKAAITKPNVGIASFKGNHQPGKSNVDVVSVGFENVRVEYFPCNLQKIFPNLEALQIENCGLKQISSEDFIGLENLVWLNLRSNQLKSLPDDLFSKMPELEVVSFSGNKIEFASSKLIKPIVGNQLEFFSLGDNTGMDEVYSRDNYRTIQELMAKIDEKFKPPTPQMIAKPATTQMIAKPQKPHPISNFVIVVDSKEFPVNKNVLAGQSPVLAKMFKVKKNCRSASKLEISDLSAEAVEAFLDYLYERKRPDAKNAVEIFKLASKYEVTKLKTICELIIQDNLDESNAFEIFKLACGPHKSEKLKVAAFGKLQEKFGGELDDDLINNPEKLQKIVEAKKVLDDLMIKI